VKKYEVATASWTTCITQAAQLILLYLMLGVVVRIDVLASSTNVSDILHDTDAFNVPLYL